jgi:sigma-E factor negative regulatory protein RseC
MIEEQAQVVEIKGNRLLLQAQTQSSCGNCSVSKGCGTSLLAKVVGRKFTHFQAENNINAKVGDTVVVGIAEDALLKGSVMMYVLPVMCMLGFALLADYLLTASPSWLLAEYRPSMDIIAISQYRDLMIAASSIMGLVLGSLISKWYFDRQSSARLFAPVVLRKIINHGKL